MQITKSFTPRNRADWRAWLVKNHDREQEVWLVYLKPASGGSNIDYESSVEEALCFGWVDSLIQKIDDEKYARKFNPRRPESKWSETNKRRVVKVIREGQMTKAGMARITFEVEDVDLGRPKAKRPPVKMPYKIQKALKSDPKVWTAFQKVAPSLKRNYILWLADAKNPETFERRLKKLVDEVMSGRPTSNALARSHWTLQWLLVFYRQSCMACQAISTSSSFVRQLLNAARMPAVPLKTVGVMKTRPSSRKCLRKTFTRSASTSSLKVKQTTFMRTGASRRKALLVSTFPPNFSAVAQLRSTISR
jgi:uncharacterized protein YdeI (YjbR/CyaY-like superfamily)